MSIFKAITSAINSLFASEPDKRSKPLDYIPSKEYDPSLIPALLDDHQQLLVMFGNIQNAVSQRDNPMLYEALKKFGSALKNHIAVENMKFYHYVEEHYKNDKSTRERVKHFRIEMEGITVVINRFLKQHTKPDLTPQEWASLPANLSELAVAISKRLHDEETELYAMYKR